MFIDIEFQPNKIIIACGICNHKMEPDALTVKNQYYCGKLIGSYSSCPSCGHLIEKAFQEPATFKSV
jgi:hypothetical protein